MNQSHIFRSLIFITLFSLSTQYYTLAQSSSPLRDGTVEEQLDYVINKSNRYQQYKVIESSWMNTLRSNVVDTLSAAYGRINTQEAQLTQMNNRIDSLQNELNETYAALDEAIVEKNSLTMLGIQMDKTVYNGILFTIIILLAAGIAVSIFLYKKSNNVTVTTKKELRDTKESFDAYRKESREKYERTVVKHHNEMKSLKERAGI